MDNEESETVEATKKSRHRKKQLYNSILQQMEFYFSDSNLSKDRFLAQLIFENPYVDLSVFMNFNKIRKLNCSAEDICKAISKSELIELSEDKQKIRRKTEIKQKENVEACTIYIENIKSNDNHESLKQVFSDFGNVVYVSIPKYRQSKVNKGFAFIEFETESEVQNALQYFENIGCRMSSSVAPEELKSIQTHEENVVDGTRAKVDNTESQESKKRKHNLDEDCLNKKEDEQNHDENVTKVNDTVHKIKKRKGSFEKDAPNKGEQLSVDNPTNHQVESEVVNKSTNVNDSDGTNSDTEFRKPKRCKENNGKVTDDLSNKKCKISKKKRKLSEKDNESNKKVKAAGDYQRQTEGNIENPEEKTELETSEEGEVKKKKKPKKDKKKNYIKELGLKILSKKEWKVMRNRYLDLQKKKMKEFKQHLYRQKMNQRMFERGRMFHEYPQEQEENQQSNPPKLEFVPGVIVKLKLTEAETDAKKIKNDVKSVSEDVKYVDVIHTIDGEEVFVRFGTAEGAKEFCNNEYAAVKSLLEGDAERSYWEKIQNDKNVKFQKNTKKVRGRDKLLKKAEKANAQHIKFEETE